MPRLKSIDDASATGDAKELLDTVRATYGTTPNMLRAMANSPALLKGYTELSNALANTLTRQLNERIAIAIAEQRRRPRSGKVRLRLRMSTLMDQGSAMSRAFARARWLTCPALDAQFRARCASDAAGAAW